MKKFKSILTICMALAMLLSCIPAVYAAEVPEATINMDANCSLTIWKYDWTNAVKDGVWNEDSFISTGWRESYVEDVLGDGVRDGDSNGSPDHSLGNGQTSNGYAIKGVGFTIANVATPVTFSESENDQHPDYNLTKLLYAFDKVESKDLLAAIGLANGKDRYENADYLNADCWFYESDVLNKAMAAALADNSTTVKNALEAYIAANPNRVHMALTDNNGKTIQRNLSVGLYLVVEDIVPEMVTSTTNPFFVSLPMTTVSGNAESSSPEGGHFWNYDVVVYPKNETGIPSLEKTVREAKKDTGNNNGTSNINDGFEHNATASAGDVMEYQILSTLPTITSNATSLTTYNFYDTISEGLTYNKSLRRTNKSLKLICAVPFEGFESKWPPDWIKHYKMVRKQADWVEIICPEYTPDAYQKRNMWLVNRSTRLIAVWDGLPSGTKNTVDYANSQGVPVRLIDM